MTAILKARGLTKRYGDRIALDHASVSVQAGEFVVVLGASGSGKTTLFRCLTRLIEPDSGEMYVAGQPIHALSGRNLASAWCSSKSISCAAHQRSTTSWPAG